MAMAPGGERMEREWDKVAKVRREMAIRRRVVVMMELRLIPHYPNEGAKAKHYKPHLVLEVC